MEHIAKLQNMKMRSADVRTKSPSKYVEKLLETNENKRREVIKKKLKFRLCKKTTVLIDIHLSKSGKIAAKYGGTHCKNAKNEIVFFRCPAKKLIKINMYQNFLINK